MGVILWGAQRVRQTLEQEVARLEKYPAFRVGWDHEAYTYDHLAEHDPTLLAAMRDALDRFAGRLGVASCTYGQPLSMFIDGESNIRQLTMAMETVERRLGRPLRGQYRFELALLPFEGDWRAADLHRRALEYNFPPVTWKATWQCAGGGDAGAARLPADGGAVLRVRGRGEAILTALYESGGRTYARFCEYAGQPAEVSLDWLGRAAQLTPTDLRHRPTAPAAGSVALRPWQVQTLRIN